MLSTRARLQYEVVLGLQSSPKKWGKKMAKEIVLTDRSIQTYSNFGIEPRCRRCGRIFKPGDTVIKTKVHAYKMDNPFFCIEHFYSEITDKIIITPIGDDFFTNKER